MPDPPAPIDRRENLVMARPLFVPLGELGIGLAFPWMQRAAAFVPGVGAVLGHGPAPGLIFLAGDGDELREVAIGEEAARELELCALGSSGRSGTKR